MNQGEKPAPTFSGKERRGSPDARKSFDAAVARSMFAPLFDRMVAGNETNGILTPITLANEGKTNYAREVLAMRTKFRKLKDMGESKQVASFLTQAAALVPSLNEALAGEIIIGLEHAAGNMAYSKIVETAVDTLLSDPAAISECNVEKLRALRAKLDGMVKEEMKGGGVTTPVLPITVQPAITETSIIPKLFAVVGAPLTAIAIAMLVSYTPHYRDGGSVDRLEGDQSYPASTVSGNQEPPATKQEHSQVQETNAEPAQEATRPETKLDIGLIRTSPKHQARRPKPQASKPVIIIANPDAAPSSTGNADVQDEMVAARIITAWPDEARRQLSSLSSPDAGIDYNSAARILKLVASVGEPVRAGIAREELEALAKTDAGAAAQQALDELSSNGIDGGQK